MKKLDEKTISLISSLLVESFWEISELMYMVFRMTPKFSWWLSNRNIVSHYYVLLNGNILNILNECYCRIGEPNEKIKKWRNDFFHFFRAKKKDNFKYSPYILYCCYVEISKKLNIQYFNVSSWGFGDWHPKDNLGKEHNVPKSIQAEMYEIAHLFDKYKWRV